MKFINHDNLEVRLQALSDSESQKLWAAVARRLGNARRNPTKSFWLVFVAKPAYAAIAVICLLAVGSVSTVALAEHAGPGDLLYPVERAYENLQLAVAIAPEHKAQLAVKFSQKRIKEVNRVLLQNQSLTTPLTKATDQSTTTELVVSDSDQSTTTPTTTPIDHQIKPKRDSRSLKNLDKAHQAIVGALDYLEHAQNNLKKSGDRQQAAAVDSLVGQLSQQTQEYLKDLEKIKQSLPNDTVVTEKINRSEKDLRRKFKLDTSSPEQIINRPADNASNSRN